MTLSSAEDQSAIQRLVASKIRSIPDYPQRGVDFKDITPLLSDPQAFSQAVAHVAGLITSWNVDVVAGMEARGFLIGAPAAVAANVGFVPLRKPGKLPFDHLSEDFQLEYGTATLEIHTDAIAPGDRVLIVDDILATGGTASAAARLIERAGGDVVGLSFLLELESLHGRSLLEDRTVDSLVVM